uniref:thiol oxidase n=1 Tax=viral metagenome TaxID=1070528 RepID=A0A6C0LCI3_9ZZZZ
MSPATWGPAIWIFLHTIAAKIKEDKYSAVAPQLFSFIQKICSNLPCPDCAAHARGFLSKIVFSRVATKLDLIRLLFIFHNSVNRRLKKQVFPIDNIDRYSKFSLVIAYNQFIGAFSTKGNMKLLADSFQRKLITQELRKWFLANLQNFE